MYEAEHTGKRKEIYKGASKEKTLVYGRDLSRLRGGGLHSLRVNPTCHHYDKGGLRDTRTHPFGGLLYPSDFCRPD